MQIKRSFTLSNIAIGSASGENEADFLAGFENYFYDNEGSSTKVMEPNVFFLIGRKGSGKSLLSKYVEKKFSDKEKHHDWFVKTESFRNFKYQQLYEFKDNDFTDKEYFFIWKWCLLINIAGLLVSDESSTDGIARNNLKTFLENNFGLNLNQKKVIEKSKNVKWTLGNSKIAHVSGSHDSEVQEGSYLDYIDDLEDLLVSLGSFTDSQFCIFLDDLDDGFEDTEVYEQGICSLIYAVDELNRSFWRAGFKAKFVLLLRSDIFRVLNMPDLNKFKMDNSLVLDWMPEERENSPLFTMLMHRIITALKLKIDEKDYNKVFYEIFDDRVEKRRSSIWMLDRTFTRPRDIVQILKIAGKEFPTFSKCSSYALVKTKGLYSQYLYDDVRNEMKGHKNKDFINKSLSLLRGIGKRNTITLDILKKKKPYLFRSDPGIDEVKEMLAFLYRFSVIGNIYHNSDNPSQIESYSWSHREDQVEPDYDATFTIHPGIRIALKAEASEARANKANSADAKSRAAD